MVLRNENKIVSSQITNTVVNELDWIRQLNICKIIMNTLALPDMPGGFLLLFVWIVSSNLYLDSSSVDQRSLF